MKREHRVHNISYGRTFVEDSWITCASPCGELIIAATPAKLEEAWILHRRSKGLSGIPSSGRGAPRTEHKFNRARFVSRPEGWTDR